MTEFRTWVSSGPKCFTGRAVTGLVCVDLTFFCVFITAGPMIKLCAGEEGDSEGHVL